MSKNRSLVSLVVLFRVFYITVILGLFALVVAVATHSTAHPPVAYCQQNIMTLSLTLKVYKEKKGTLPPLYSTNDSGLKMHSWRALILPYFAYEFTDQYDYTKPWDDPANMKLADKMPYEYRCPLISINELPETQPSYLILIPDSHDSAEMPSPSLLVEHPNAGFNWLEPKDITCSKYIKFLRANKLDWHDEKYGKYGVLQDPNRPKFLNTEELISIVTKYNENYQPKPASVKEDEPPQNLTI